MVHATGDPEVVALRQGHVEIRASGCPPVSLQRSSRISVDCMQIAVAAT